MKRPFFLDNLRDRKGRAKKGTHSKEKEEKERKKNIKSKTLSYAEDMSGRMNRGNGGDIEMGGNRGMQNMQTSSAKSDTSSADFDEKETDYQPVDWKKVLFTPKYAVLWVVLIIVGALTVVISLKHDQVVAALTPFAKKVRDIPAGWLIFVAVLFIISFPPLFGHEMVALLAGVVYGLWMGFAVVAAGTFVGESKLYIYIYISPGFYSLHENYLN